MDTGMNAEKLYTLEERLKLGIIPSSNTLTPANLISIMDNLFICEVMWQDGYSIAHSIATCLYLHRPSILIGNNYLYSFSNILLRRCFLIRDVIIKADVYEVI